MPESKDTMDLLAAADAHEHQHIRREDVRASIPGHGNSRIGRFNRRLALRIGSSVGTMYCAYAFLLISLISLPAALITGSPVVIIQWISGAFLQLVLLPIIIVQQNIQSETAARQSRIDSETLQLVKELNTRQLRLEEGTLPVLFGDVSAIKVVLATAAEKTPRARRGTHDT